MKNIIIFIATLAAITLSASSCDSRRIQMEAQLKPNLQAPSTYKFISIEKTRDITLADEVEDKRAWFIHVCESDRVLIESHQSLIRTEKELAAVMGYSSSLDDYERELQRRYETLAKDSSMVVFLDSVQIVSADIYNDVRRHEYKLTYDAANTYGTPVRNTCTGTFDLDGRLLEMRIEGATFPIILGNSLSIPGYYERLGMQ